MLTSVLANSQTPAQKHAPSGSRTTTQDLPVTPEYNYDSIPWYFRSICKGMQPGWYLKPGAPVLPLVQQQPVVIHSPERVPLLTIHGNVQYNYLYRSFVDTPFAQNNFQQHTIQTYLQVTVKNKYPLRVNLSQRISNSPYFRNFLDLNAQFDRNAYLQHARQQLLERIAGVNLQRPDLSKAEQTLKELIGKYQDLKDWLNSGDVRQRIVEERERQYHRAMAATNRAPQRPDPLNNLPDLDHRRLFKMKGGSKESDLPLSSRDSSYVQYIDQKKKELDSLQQRVERVQASTDSLRNNINKKLIQLNQQVYKARTLAELKRIEIENGIKGEKTKGMDRFLSHVKSIGLGRSVVNYSELTAWNVSLTGFNAAYNDGIYAAIAAGKIDYGFRDFLGRNSRQKGQQFLMGRIGLGDIEKQAIIFSAFTGRRFTYGSILSDSVSSYVNLTGYSVEAIYKKDEYTSLNIEVAKTTKPISGQQPRGEAMKSLWQFNDNANLGISVKGQTTIRKTGTALSGIYRKTGESFQSFSLFTYNTDQTSWSVKAEQPFFRNRISVTGMLRRNDFLNPFTEKTFKTSSIFKSVQLQVRFPKWPSLSLGYYPGTQLYIVDKESIRENAYYIVNGTLMYQYAAGPSRMLSSLMYNRYAGKGTDSGFVAYAGTSYMASQTIMIGKAQLQGVYVYTDQEQMQYYTLEANADYGLAEWLQAGAGIKYNRIAGGRSYWGNRASLGIDIKKLGGLRFQYEKSYLPTIWQTLYPVESGTVSWFKYF
jgi:hypothetical protein